MWFGREIELFFQGHVLEETCGALSETKVFEKSISIAGCSGYNILPQAANLFKWTWINSSGTGSNNSFYEMWYIPAWITVIVCPPHTENEKECWIVFHMKRSTFPPQTITFMLGDYDVTHTHTLSSKYMAEKNMDLNQDGFHSRQTSWVILSYTVNR